MGERENGTAQLEEAVAAYREALQELTRARPLQWAMTQMNLGSALVSLGERESGTARLEEGRFRLPRSLAGIDPRERAALLGREHRKSGCRPDAPRETAPRCGNGEAGGPADRGGFRDVT
jgi:hypothetical protein